MYYIKKHHAGIKIVSKDGYIIKDISMQRYLNILCLRVLTTLEGRIKALRHWTNYQRNLPLYIDKQHCFIHTEYLHSPNNLCINVTKILALKKAKNHTIIIFEDATQLRVEKDYQKIKKRLKRAEVILARFLAIMKTLLSKKVFSKQSFHRKSLKNLV